MKIDEAVQAGAGTVVGAMLLGVIGIIAGVCYIVEKLIALIKSHE